MPLFSIATVGLAQVAPGTGITQGRMEEKETVRKGAQGGQREGGWKREGETQIQRQRDRET